MERAQDFQTPVVTPNPAQEAEYADEWTPRYGILVGGFPVLQWNGIGEQSVGHHWITRRVWLPFVRLEVGRRNEFDGALDMPEHTVQRDWSKSDARKTWKSPRACAGDVLAAFRSQGFCVPRVLVGYPTPQALTDKVWPREVRDAYRLYRQIEYLEAFQTDDEAEAGLASELLSACYASREYVSEYVRRLKDEIAAEKGLTNPNDSLKELFYEINEPLPEQKTALVAQAMGREIVKSVAPDGRKDDAIVEALRGVGTVVGKLSDRLDRMEERFDRGPLVRDESPDGSGATDAETPNTSTRRRADGEADRRFKKE